VLAGLEEALVRLAFIASVASVVIATATAGSAGQQAPDLTPVHGVYSSPSLVDPYHLALRDALLGEHPYRKCQMLVLPSFQAEWVVYVVQDDTQGPGRLFYKTMHTQLWGNMMQQIERDAPDPRSYSIGPDAQSAALRKVTKRVDVRTVDLDASTIAALERAWTDMLMRTRYPGTPDLGLDGTSYVAANWSRGLGPLSGETWSPEEGTPTYDLVAIADQLRDLATAPPQGQPRLEAEISLMANALHVRLKALN
jgi:hypothetical protein